ncbi:MAG: OmpA family protein [Verrucomicrobiota bacterium]
MQKSVRLFSALLIAILFLPACTNKQAPSPSGGVTGGRDFGGNIIPDGEFDGNYGLELRDGNEGIQNGYYNGREMVFGILEPIYFGFDSSSIAASERTKLQKAADYLEANPTAGLLIEGHADWYGTAEYNLALGDRRAESSSSYLGTLGIDPLRIDKLSKGSLESTSGLSKSESFKDRRADLIILK